MLKQFFFGFHPKLRFPHIASCLHSASGKSEQDINSSDVQDGVWNGPLELLWHRKSFLFFSRDGDGSRWHTCWDQNLSKTYSHRSGFCKISQVWRAAVGNPGMLHWKYRWVEFVAIYIYIRDFHPPGATSWKHCGIAQLIKKKLKKTKRENPSI